jgi:hypothetical protein
MNYCPPVAFFVFNRPDYTVQSFACIWAARPRARRPGLLLKIGVNTLILLTRRGT